MFKSKFKYLLAFIVCLFISQLFYRNFIYYSIPLDVISDELKGAVSCGVQIGTPNSSDRTTFTTQDISDCNMILEYFKSLEFKPSKKHNFDIGSQDFSYHVTFSSVYYSPIIIEVWAEDTSIVFIHSSSPDFLTGYYKISNNSLDYNYLNEIITK